MGSQQDREERLRRACAGLVEIMLAMGTEPETAYTVAGVFASGVRREWEKKAK